MIRSVRVNHTSSPTVRDIDIVHLEEILDRGSLEDWRPVLEEIRKSPDGEVARRVEDICRMAPMYGTSPFFLTWIERSRSLDRSD